MVPLYACHVQPSTRADVYMALMDLLSDQPMAAHLHVFRESHQIFEDWRVCSPMCNVESHTMQRLVKQVICSS